MSNVQITFDPSGNVFYNWFTNAFPERDVNTDDYANTWRNRFDQGIDSAFTQMDTRSRRVLVAVLDKMTNN